MNSCCCSVHHCHELRVQQVSAAPHSTLWIEIGIYWKEIAPKLLERVVPLKMCFKVNNCDAVVFLPHRFNKLCPHFISSTGTMWQYVDLKPKLIKKSKLDWTHGPFFTRWKLREHKILHSFRFPNIQIRVNSFCTLLVIYS